MDMMAEGQIWLANHPHAQNQAYNINNGDTFRWSEASPPSLCLPQPLLNIWGMLCTPAEWERYQLLEVCLRISI